jgi:hypothetical protein
MAHPIAHLRSIRESLGRGCTIAADDAGWLCGVLSVFLTGGSTLDQAAGLACAAGSEPWWKSAARQERDAMLRHLRALHYAGMTVSAAAAAIERDARRYEVAGFVHDRSKDIPPGMDTARGCLYRALEVYGKIPGPRQLRTILQMEVTNQISFPSVGSTSMI